MGDEHLFASELIFLFPHLHIKGVAAMRRSVDTGKSHCLSRGRGEGGGGRKSQSSVFDGKGGSVDGKHNVYMSRVHSKSMGLFGKNKKNG